MRLLDLLGQGRCPLVRSNDGCRLPGAESFGEVIRQCPLRYILSDTLVQCATQLAYAEGERMAGCLDLIHLPARSVWIEWSEAPQLQALAAIPRLDARIEPRACRSGVLVQSASDCRSGLMRTFWSDSSDQAFLSPMITCFDLSDTVTVPSTLLAEAFSPLPDAAWRDHIVLNMRDDTAVDEVLSHLRFRLDDPWARYYEERCTDARLKEQILRANLAHCAFDAPMILAFALLLGARDLLPRHRSDFERLNRARLRSGKPPLLEHIEVTAPLDTVPVPAHESPAGPARHSPRLHHVRGHLVRRDDTVFWRSPHLRGSGRLGQIRTRTVEICYRGSRQREASNPDVLSAAADARMRMQTQSARMPER